MSFLGKENLNMSPSPALPNYKKLASLFKKIKSDLHPAQTHGLLCGYLCVTKNPGKSEPDFEKSLLDVQGNKQSEKILSDLYKASYHSLKQFSFEFSLILPDDSANLNTRVEALGLWCQGFLIGISQAENPVQEHPDSEVKEALSDLSEISQVNFGDIPENEEDEAAYLELAEYTRLSALMIFNTLHSEVESEQKGSLLH